ncbi:hypothetical protein WR25_13054 [Diploscapter pachys]|uniref:Uncharacterized protein n=1 Tax=Diploscapter pachys TaxID=2018661 RepID=A0A2A2JUI3_9BILA|nr:hypothetical protein WR25_13054 [Diploscapter pachys]
MSNEKMSWVLKLLEQDDDTRASDFPSRSMVERIFGLAATDMKDVSDPPVADASELEHQPNEWDRLVEELVKLIESNPAMEEFARVMRTRFGHVDDFFDLRLAFDAFRSNVSDPYCSAANAIVLYRSAVDRSVVTRTAIAIDEIREMVTEELEGRDEIAPEAKKKKKTVENVDIEDRGYVLKESSAKDVMLLKEPGFRLGNIRAAIIEMHANYRGCSIKDEIHRVLVNVMIQILPQDCTTKYTIANRVHKGHVQFPLRLADNIAAGIIRCIDIREQDDKQCFRLRNVVPVPFNSFVTLIMHEIDLILADSPMRRVNKKKHCFSLISDEIYRNKLAIDVHAVQDGWYEKNLDEATVSFTHTSPMASSSSC